MDSQNGLAKREMESVAEDFSDKNRYEEEENEDDSMSWELPKAQGLYDPQNEHEACGVGFIVAIDGKRSHKVC